MDITKEIENAITTHQKWMNHVELMVAMTKNNEVMSTKKAEEDQETIKKIRQDNNCSFGRWLYSIENKKIKTSQYYSDIVELHKQFHQEAAYILVLILNGKHNLAQELLSTDSIYNRCSQALIKKMSAWQKTFQK